MLQRVPQISEKALADLDDIWLFVFQDSLDSTIADRVIDGIYEQAVKLANMPGMGHKREDLADELLRFWPVYEYLIVYRPDTDPIEIARVLHSARDIRRILSDLGN